MLRKLISRLKKNATPTNAAYFAHKQATRKAQIFAQAKESVENCTLSARSGDDKRVMCTGLGSVAPFIATPASISEALTLAYPELALPEQLQLLDRLRSRVRRERGEAIRQAEKIERDERHNTRNKTRGKW